MHIRIKLSRFYRASVVGIVLLIITTGFFLQHPGIALASSIIAVIYGGYLISSETRDTQNGVLEIRGEQVLLNDKKLSHVSYTLIAGWYVIMKYQYTHDTSGKIHTKILFPDSIEGADIHTLVRSQYMYT